MKKIMTLALMFVLTSCAELQQIASQFPVQSVTEGDIATGLQQALQKGIDQQVTLLTKENGFFGNQLVKISLPEELQYVDKALRNIGLDDLADQGILLLNRAAEDAVKEATPIFVAAVKDITFTDARNILMGDNLAATSYLENKTSDQLSEKFKPVIKNSLDKVGANDIWKNIITKYNSIPLTKKVDPDLTSYVNNKALDGVFTMIGEEEKEIRSSVSERTTLVLQKVFALQDGV
ncbi:DUF4197 domain-containing protein [Robertkochia solimangrovi]|uniref:DUF4197 domain-containing protein n=1 Tax=Robertkochia solimangrovi TaxID=2213046 RepID=UPI0011803D1A|nr:DUF4197 domain-containing protein [Robertkochia solimangrovi]TRZ43741.1 DUF4197 domain-containing protein [Robertkochia solimangrovi]